MSTPEGARTTRINVRILARQLGAVLQRHRRRNGHSSRLAAAAGGMSGSEFRTREAGHRDLKLSTLVNHCRAIGADPKQVLGEALAACGWEGP